MHFPSAWYTLCLSSELPAGGERRVAMLATSMTARRRADGTVHAVDDGSGRPCQAADINGMIMIWHGPDDPEFEIAPVAELAAPDWRPARWGKPRPFATTIDNVMRDAADNHHFGPVHGLLNARTEASMQGPFFDVTTEGLLDTSRFAGPRLFAHLRIDGRLHGLGLLVYHMTVTMGLQVRYVTVSAATPIDAQHVRIHLALAMQRAPLGPLGGLVERLVFKNYALNFELDRPYWESPEGRLVPEAQRPQDAELLGRYDRWAAGFSAGPAASRPPHHLPSASS